MTRNLPTSIWVAAGIFGLLGGGLLMLFTNSLTGYLLWLTENYRVGASPLPADGINTIEDGLRMWAWSGIIVGAISLILADTGTRDRVTRAISRTSDQIRPMPLAADRYDHSFFVSAGAVLLFTTLTHWSLTIYKDVDWFGGEDGVSEWWSVATYLTATVFAGATGLRLRLIGHPRLAITHGVLAVVFLIGAMEEISWGQRLFTWGTPQVLGTFNEQGETTFHNLENVEPVIFSLFFWGSAAGLAGSTLRAAWHLQGKVTTADFFLPSLVLAPALLLIVTWRIGDLWMAVSLPRLVMEAFDHGPQGSEVPEVLLGLCLSLYTYANMRRAMALPGPGI